MADHKTQTSTNPGKTFNALQNNLRNYLRRRVDESAVDDLLQDIFVKALNAINNKKAPKNLPGWLYAAARTTVVDYYRDKKSSVEILGDEMPHVPDDEEDILERKLATCLKPLAQKLPEKYRDTLIATDFEGRKMRDVSEAEGLSLSAIKSRASRARSMLKEKLFECCHVQLADGKVIDYQHKTTKFCGDDCGENRA